ncbi:TPA: hypothetical protein ROY17_005801 [Bacillus thuringiensis]|nr:hypothetical protein [Bacillus thuringiensis]
MLTEWEFENYVSDKQCIKCSLKMWKEWMEEYPNHNTDVATEGIMYVVSHMKLRKHQVSLLYDFFNEYLNLLKHGEEQAESFYKILMRM